MNTWIVVAAVPVILSTLLAVSACMLSSRRSRAWESREPEAAPEMHADLVSTAPPVSTGRSVPS